MVIIIIIIIIKIITKLIIMTIAVNTKIIRTGRIMVEFFFFFFLSGFSFTDTDNSQDSRGREGPSYSTLPLPPAHEHSDIYLQLCT